MYIEGIDPNRIFTSDEVPPAVDATSFEGGYGEALALGTRGRDDLGNSYILLEAGAAISEKGYVGSWDENFEFTLVDTSNDVPGLPLAANVGLPEADGDRFWAIVEGIGDLRVLADAAADSALNTTGTAGVLDDDGSTDAFIVEGLHLMTGEPDSSQSSVQARYMNPHLASAAIPA